MEPIRRAANGKRLFSPEFKREQMGRVLRGEVTAAELSRELQVSYSVVKRWKQALGRKTLEMEILRAARWARAGRLAGGPEARSKHTGRE